jgi:mevalonate kinase
MQQISYSAPAKIILSGEHSSMYLEPALAATFDLKLTFNLKENEKPLKNKDEIIIKSSQVIKDYLTKNDVKFQEKNFSYEINSEIPKDKELGYTNALVIASLASFYEFYSGKKLDSESQEDVQLLNNFAKEFIDQNQFQVTPINAYGDLTFYRREFVFLDYLAPINLKIPTEWQDQIYLIDSGEKKESDLDMVKFVESQVEENPAMYKKSTSRYW